MKIYQLSKQPARRISSCFQNLAAQKRISCSKNPVVNSLVPEGGKKQDRQTMERCSQSIFRSVSELSINGQSIITERTSIGLNVALRTLCEKTDAKEVTSKCFQENSHCLGITEATMTPCLGSFSRLERLEVHYRFLYSLFLSYMIVLFIWQRMLSWFLPTR